VYVNNNNNIRRQQIPNTIPSGGWPKATSSTRRKLHADVLLSFASHHCSSASKGISSAAKGAAREGADEEGEGGKDGTKTPNLDAEGMIGEEEEEEEGGAEWGAGF
jgi:hypothetical protein